MTASATLAATIRHSLAMISFTAPTPPAQRSATTAAATRSGWRPAQSGSVAVTWTRATARRPDTSSAWNFSSRLTRSTARRTKATRPRRPTLPSTPGVARLRKVVRLTHCKLLLKLKPLLAFMMVVAAGNAGSACSTVSDPPGIYAASYTVGALNTGTDTIAGFSSRGPVTADGSNRIKPDITAPGTNTRSATNTCDNLLYDCQRHVHGHSAYCRRHGVALVGHSELAESDRRESRRFE